MPRKPITYDKEYFFVMDYFNTGKPYTIRIGKKGDEYSIYHIPGNPVSQSSIRKNESGEWEGYRGRMLLDGEIKAIGEQIDLQDGPNKI